MARVTLSTGSLYTLGTARAFELAQRAGFDGVELLIDDRWDTRQPDYLRRLVRETGVPIESVHSPFVPIPSWPKDEVGRVKRALALAEAVGARTLNVHVPRRFSDLTVSGAGRKFVFPFLPPAADQPLYGRWLLDGGLDAAQRGSSVAIAVENLPARRVLGRRVGLYALNTWEELSLFDTLCLDTTHCGTWGVEPVSLLDRLGSRIKHVHLSDFIGRHQHQPVGAGYLALDRFLSGLAEREYSGSVVVELTPFTLPVQDETKLVAELKRNLDFCRLHLKSATLFAGGSVAGAPLMQGVPA